MNIKQALFQLEQDKKALEDEMAGAIQKVLIEWCKKTNIPVADIYVSTVLLHTLGEHSKTLVKSVNVDLDYRGV